MTYLLDTHILVWWFEDQGRLSKAQDVILRKARVNRSPLLVANISLWEVATLAMLGRLRLERPLRDWLECATAPPLVRRCPVTPAIAAQVASLPESFHRDPADRLIVSTAILEGATLLTSDQRIINSRVVTTI
ncbi:MAG: type II toxin-antitoxin system VapC family toxin [Vulcanimicrobiota bacterium]